MLIVECLLWEDRKMMKFFELEMFAKCANAIYCVPSGIWSWLRESKGLLDSNFTIEANTGKIKEKC